MIQFVLRFPQGFADHQLIPERLKKGEVRTVNAARAKQIMQSDPSVQVLERRLPINKKNIPAKKKVKSAAKKES